jgi:hypothetical protein
MSECKHKTVNWYLRVGEQEKVDGEGPISEYADAFKACYEKEAGNSLCKIVCVDCDRYFDTQGVIDMLDGDLADWFSKIFLV